MHYLGIGISLTIFSIIGLAQDKKNPVISLQPETETSIRVLPRRYSIKEYTPTPLDQKEKSMTSPAWATAYSALSTSLAIYCGMRTQELIDQYACSPDYVYTLARNLDTATCDIPITIESALDVLQNYGTPARKLVPGGCMKAVDPSLQRYAVKNRVLGYHRLFDADAPFKADYIRRELVADRPCIVGLSVDSMFFDAKKYYRPKIKKIRDSGIAQALVVIGYDDDLSGGALELMNSLGLGWGNDGFIWMKYEDFNQSCTSAFTIEPKLEYDDKVITATIQIQDVNANLSIPIKTLHDRLVILNPLSSLSEYSMIVETTKPTHLYLYSKTTKSTDIVYPIDDNHDILNTKHTVNFRLDDQLGFESLELYLSTIPIQYDKARFTQISNNYRCSTQGNSVRINAWMEESLMVYCSLQYQHTKAHLLQNDLSGPSLILCDESGGVLLNTDTTCNWVLEVNGQPKQLLGYAQDESGISQVLFDETPLERKKNNSFRIIIPNTQKFPETHDLKAIDVYGNTTIIHIHLGIK